VGVVGGEEKRGEETDVIGEMKKKKKM